MASRPRRSVAPPVGGYGEESLSDSSVSVDSSSSSDSSDAVLGRRRRAPQRPAESSSSSSSDSSDAEPEARQQRGGAPPSDDDDEEESSSAPSGDDSSYEDEAPPQQRRGRQRSRSISQQQEEPEARRQRGGSLPPRLQPDVMQHGFNIMAHPDPLIIVLRYLRLDYIDRLTVKQLSWLVRRLTRSPEARVYRPPHIRQEVDAHLERQGNNPDAPFHVYERNEYVCSMDYLIKFKVNLERLRRLIHNRDRRIKVAYLPDSSGYLVPDVWVVVPRRISIQLCQGASFLLFG